MNDSCDEGRTVEGAVVFWHRHILVDQRLHVFNIVLILRVIDLLQPIRLLAKQELPNARHDQIQHAQHAHLALAGTSGGLAAEDSPAAAEPPDPPHSPPPPAGPPASRTASSVSARCPSAHHHWLAAPPTRSRT
eukprot:TRINITY_DN2943_c0_g1_i1.p2 TRINITY_DN2943_c0_g1~~TRINITY_DN2943_c0_g1_i1.p2  ORF type:complete len:134 (-),score=5.90 TRINITY_DN2943_c0_g1_i1:106-507(-)